MQLPLGHEKMSPIQLALEVALNELTSLHGLHVTDVPEEKYVWEIDTKDVTELIVKALETLMPALNKGSVQDDL